MSGISLSLEFFKVLTLVKERRQFNRNQLTAYGHVFPEVNCLYFHQCVHVSHVAI